MGTPAIASPAVTPEEAPRVVGYKQDYGEQADKKENSDDGAQGVHDMSTSNAT